MRVGGNDDSTFKPLDGTNYKQWAPKMKAYLMSKELWGYVSGPAAIFVDFRYVINFKFDEKKDPSVQVVELNTKLDVLSTHSFTLDERIQAMIILSGLPQS